MRSRLRVQMRVSQSRKGTIMNRTVLLLISTLAVLLIDSGCGARGGSAETKFIRNCRGGNLRIVQTLLDRGYVKTINATDTVGNTALMLASGRGHGGIVRLLLFTQSVGKKGTRNLHGADVQTLDNPPASYDCKANVGAHKKGEYYDQ